MPGPIPYDLSPPTAADSVPCEVVAQAESVTRIVRVAHALLLGGRMVCLEGLEALVEALCAKTLLLERERAPEMRLRLLALRAELDAMAPLLDNRSGQVSCTSTIS